MAKKFKTREEWLSFVTQESRPAFKSAGFPIPKEVRFAIGFTSSGARGKSMGECWVPKASADGHSEIFIKPTEADPRRVAGILWHELVKAPRRWMPSANCWTKKIRNAINELLLGKPAPR